MLCSGALCCAVVARHKAVQRPDAGARWRAALQQPASHSRAVGDQHAQPASRHHLQRLRVLQAAGGIVEAEAAVQRAPASAAAAAQSSCQRAHVSREALLLPPQLGEGVRLLARLRLQRCQVGAVAAAAGCRLRRLQALLL